MYGCATMVLLSNSTVGITSVSCAPFFIGGCFFRGNGNNTHSELWREDGFKGALFCGNTRYCLGTWCCHLPDFFAVHFNILLLENIKRECVREGRLQTIWVHSTCREVHCPALANTIYIYNNLQVKMFTTTMIHSKRIYPPKIHTSLLMLLSYLLYLYLPFPTCFSKQ